MQLPSSTSGPTTRSASARTARPTSRSSTWPRCARSRAWTSCARPTPTRPPSPGGDPRAHRPAGRLACPGRTCRPSTARSRPADGRPGGYVLARRSAAPRGDPHRDRFRGAARARRPREASRPRASRPGSCRCPASSGSTSRTPTTARGAAPGRPRPGQRRGRGRPGLARVRRRRRPIVSLEHFGASPRPRRCSASSASPPTPWSPPPRQSSRRSARLTRVHRPDGHGRSDPADHTVPHGKELGSSHDDRPLRALSARGSRSGSTTSAGTVCSRATSRRSSSDRTSSA
jgi:hypothetical protein